MKKKIYSFLFFLVFLVGCAFLFPAGAFAHLPRIIYGSAGDIAVQNPDISQAFYDELKGSPRNFFIESDKDFELYINLLLPMDHGRDKNYFPSAAVYLVGDAQASEEGSILLDGTKFEWQEFYEPFGRDYYFKGPEITRQLPAGRYKITVFSKNSSLAWPAGSEELEEELKRENFGKYVLAVGKIESFDLNSALNALWQIPLLKISFFNSSVLQFFLTPFGIGLVALIGLFLILLAVINYIAGVIDLYIKHNQAKTLLLTSNGMVMKEEIIKLLQKPAYDITVAFINTAAKPQEDQDYVKRDWTIMRDEMGFNVEEVDIEGKKEREVFELLKFKDIIFVEGGNTFYLLNAMRKCNFEKIIRKLLKLGKVYIGVSAGSIVAGRTVKPAEWLGDEYENKNGSKNKNMKGLGLVPYDIFVHYTPEYAEIIKQQIKNPKKRAKKLKIITDEQAILVQGRESYIIGKGEAAVV